MWDWNKKAHMQVHRDAFSEKSWELNFHVGLISEILPPHRASMQRLGKVTVFPNTQF